MRFFLSSFRLHLRRLARRGTLLACLLLMPLITLGLGIALPTHSQDSPVLVGIYLPQPGAQNSPAGQLWESLQHYSDSQLAFVQATSQNQLEEMVAARAWDCGYVLREDFSQHIEAGRYNRLFTRIDSPGTTLGSMADWLVAAALLDVCAPGLSMDYLTGSGIVPAAQQQAAHAAAKAAFSAGQLMELELVRVNGAPAGESYAASTGAALLQAAIALLLLLFACLCAHSFAADMQTGFFHRIRPFAPAVGLFVPYFAACMLPAGVSGALCLTLARCFYPSHFIPLAPSLGLLAIYLLYLGCFAFFLASLFQRPGSIAAILPYLLVAGLLLCPILADLAHYIPGGTALSLALPPTLYLWACAGRAPAVWQMLLAAALYAMAGAGIALVRARGPQARQAPA